MKFKDDNFISNVNKVWIATEGINKKIFTVSDAFEYYKNCMKFENKYKYCSFNQFLNRLRTGENKKIYLSGNKGGDFIKITQTEEQEKNSCCNIKIGHCCVMLLETTQIPIELITNLFFRFLVIGEDGMGRSTKDELKDFAKELFNYDENFINDLCNKIKKENNYENV